MQQQEENETFVDRINRTKRIQRFKKIIIVSLILAILLPILLCIILFAKVNKLEKEIEDLSLARASLKEITTSETTKESLEGVWNSDSIRYLEEVENQSESQVFSAENENTKADTIKVYLTFDDGPSGYTDDILNILNSYNVHATFFVVGKEGEQYEALYRRIVDEGNAIGMHSYSHKYNEIYKSEDAFVGDLTKLQEYIYEVTGAWSRIYRFPGGSSNKVNKGNIEKFIDYLDMQDINYYDWNVSARDATSSYVSVAQITNNVISGIQSYPEAIVLMHDSDDKRTTVEALPIIIEKLLDMGNVEILPITDETFKVQHVTIEK